jgi:hypothetical protein
MNVVELHLQNHFYHIQPRAGVALRWIRVTPGFNLPAGFTCGYSRLAGFTRFYLHCTR